MFPIYTLACFLLFGSIYSGVIIFASTMPSEMILTTPVLFACGVFFEYFWGKFMEALEKDNENKRNK